LFCSSQHGIKKKADANAALEARRKQLELEQAGGSGVRKSKKQKTSS
jgi:hypothetical protein